MHLPRLIYYQDSHHFHAKRLDPPVSVDKLRWPIDELLGSGVGALAFGLGYGDVYFHDTKVGRMVGQKQETWESFIDWRIMRMVQDARRHGTDQVREVIERGRRAGLPVFPSLKLQSCDRPGSDRCGSLKWNHADEVCMNVRDDLHPRYEWCYDFAHPLVREDKLNVLREIMSDYAAEGVELDFMFVPKYFKPGEEDSGAVLMTAFLDDVRRVADEVGRARGESIAIGARVFQQRDANLRLGLDVETWLANGSLDFVVGQMCEQFLDTGAFEARWLANAASAAGAAFYIRPPRRVYDERTPVPERLMYRGLAQAALRQGAWGMYLGYLHWPFSQTEYDILRDLSHPEALARRDKRHLLQPRESGLTLEELVDYQGDYPKMPRDAESEITDPPVRYLPAELREGETVRIPILVWDEWDAARIEGEARAPILTLRFSSFCVEDDVVIAFNDAALPLCEAEMTDELAVQMPVSPRGSPFEAPLSMSAHWFRWRLDPSLLREGENILTIETRALAPEAGFERALNGVELHTRYREFVRPQGLATRRIAGVGA